MPRIPSTLAGLAMGLCFAAANEVVNLVFGVWLEESFGLQIAALGAVGFNLPALAALT